MNPSPYLLRLSGPASQRWMCPSTTKYFSPSFSYIAAPPSLAAHLSLLGQALFFLPFDGKVTLWLASINTNIVGKDANMRHPLAPSWHAREVRPTPARPA